MTTPGMPPAQGLYDPAHEHDACGVGFVVDIKGRKSHAIVSQALTGAEEPPAPRGLRLRGRTPATAPGILIQMPDRVPARASAPGSASRCPPPGRVRRRPRLPAARARPAATGSRRSSSSIVERRGPAAPRLARRARPTTPRWARRARSVEPVDQAGLHRPRAPTCPTGTRLRAQALRRSASCFEKAVAAARRLASRSSSTSRASPANTLIYKGMLSADQIETDVPGRDRPATWSRRWPWSTSGSAPTPSRPGRSRTRTGTSPTTARSTRCAATSTGCGPARRSAARASSATTCGRSCRSRARAGSDSADLRQRARVPGDERPLAAPRDADDDPRAVAEARVDERGAAGLLRVPRLA